MNKHDPVDRADAPAARSWQRERLHALLFTGAALGTTLMLLGTSGMKIPVGLGD